MIIRPRADWQSPSQPVVGPSIVLGKIELVPAHYTAADSVGSDTPAVLRAIQNDYTVNRGYSIGYNFAVDKAAEAWELRGVDIKCAANKDMNEVTVAILCLVDGADAMTPAMVDTFTQIGAHVQDVVGRELLVVGHRDIGSTSCPGDGIYGQVQSGILDPAGAPDPEPPTPTPTGEADMIRVDYGVPGTDDWWARMLIGGVGLTWVQGHANDGLDQLVPAHIQVANDAHMYDLIATYRCVGPPPSTWGGNPGLRQAWADSTAK